MSISSFILRSGVISLACLSLLSPTNAQYSQVDNFSGASFFENFDFFTGADPTNGFVNYVDGNSPAGSSLISATDGGPAFMRVDSTTVLNATNSTFPGRNSVRITSKKSYTHALIISDIAHMPGGICGTWPAHWTLGPNWPSNGEIDIIEGVNNANDNLMSLHTSPNCTINGNGMQGTFQQSNCDTTINYSSGCGITASTTTSYGSAFNSGGGGVYATEWTSQYIRIWFFPASAGIPPNVLSSSPDPTTWPLPQANFEGNCDIDSHFADHSIIFDTTFCGDYGNADWNNNPTCQALGNGTSCPSYVASTPGAFSNAYWAVNSVKVFQSQKQPASSVVVSPPTATPVNSIVGPGMGKNATSSFTASSTQNYVKPVATNPPAIGNFRYVGCASSSSGFSTFILAESNALMTLERCVTECVAFTYAGIFDTQCFCANALDSATSTSITNQCNTPCPGNLNEQCGGSLIPTRLAHRQQLANTNLITLYVTVTTQSTPLNLVLGYGMGGGAPANALSSIVLATTYIDVCNACQGGYTTITYAQTIEQCGCRPEETAFAAMGKPSIPMTTVVQACASCGEGGASDTVTVTKPCALVDATAAIAVQTGSPPGGGAFLVGNGPEVAAATEVAAASGNGATPANSPGTIGTISPTITAGMAQFTGVANSLEVRSVGAFMAAIVAALAML